MDGYTLIATLLSASVFIAYLNHRFIKLQTSCAVMIAGLILSILMLLLEHAGLHSLQSTLKHALVQIDFQHMLLQGMLSFLLFAGALYVDITALKHNLIPVLMLAIPGTLLSTVLTGLAAWWVQPYLHLHLHLYACFLLGAIISPTDPIAVLATFKTLGAPRDLQTTLAGESLLNDGIGIVIFLTILASLHSGTWVGGGFFVRTFLREALGGILYGAALGVLAQAMMRSIKDHKMILMISISVVAGGYALANALHLSGPLAMVVCGLIVDWEKHQHGFSQAAIHSMNSFWSTVDELLNTLLFLILGLELLAIPLSLNHLMLMLSFIPISLAARWLSVSASLMPLRMTHKNFYSSSALSWYGLRGGLAVALALSVPAAYGRDTLLMLTYGVVVFSVLVQALSIQVHYQKKNPNA
jgi:monovalent cation:H+ antiporter, CPA1 family